MASRAENKMDFLSEIFLIDFLFIYIKANALLEEWLDERKSSLKITKEHWKYS